MPRDKQIEKDFQAISNITNNLGFNPEEVAKLLASQHRTLQQCFMRLCWNFIQEMAKHESCDARNRASVDFCKQIVAHIGETTYFPFI